MCYRECMNKKPSLLWPLAIIIGIAFIILATQEVAIGGFGILLMWWGALRIMIASIKRENTERIKPLGIIWALAFLSTMGLYSGRFAEGLEAINWVFPAAGFNLLGIIMIFKEYFRLLNE